MKNLYSTKCLRDNLHLISSCGQVLESNNGISILTGMKNEAQ